MLEGLNFGEEGNNPIEVLQDLLSKEGIEIKTDLNITQIRILCTVAMKKKLLDNNKLPLENRKDHIELLVEVLYDFKVLMCSNDRKSRNEIIGAISNIAKEMGMENLLGLMGGQRQ